MRVFSMCLCVFLCVFDYIETHVFVCFSYFLKLGNGKSIPQRNIVCHMFQAHGIHVFDIRKK